MADQYFGYFAVGILLLFLTGVCWSGAWRGWAEAPFFVVRSMMITIVPGLGLLGFSFGLSGLLPPGFSDAAVAISMLAPIAGLVLSLTEPDWYGPRWYRRFNHAFTLGTQGRLSWMAEDPRRPGESSVEATQRLVYSDRPTPPGASVRLISETSGRIGGVAGRSSTLLFFPQAPLFAVSGSAERPPMNEVIPAESLRGARKLSSGVGLDGSVRRAGLRSYLVPRVRIDTDERSWLFESRKAKKVARAIEQRYLDQSRDIYGLPLDKDTPPEFKKGATSQEPDSKGSQPHAPHSSARPKAWRPRG